MQFEIPYKKRAVLCSQMGLGVGASYKDFIAVTERVGIRMSHLVSGMWSGLLGMLRNYSKKYVNAESVQLVCFIYFF